MLTRVTRSKATGALLALSVVTLSAGARAYGSPADVAAAQGLYDDARKLMKDGNFATACPKLEESNRLDKSVSTEFHLADCYEHVGRTASAWALFLQVASESKAQGRNDGEQLARDRAAALAPKVAHLTVNVPAASRADGLELKRDGEALGQGQWNTAVPIDAGKHVIAASAPGRQPWETNVEVADGKTASVDVPALEQAAAPPPSATPATTAPAPSGAPAAANGSVSTVPGSDQPSGGSGRKTIALVVGGAGVVALGVGGFFGLSAMSKNSDSNADGHCAGNKCDAVGTAARNDAISAGNLSTIFVGVGAAALIAGGILWFTAPSSTATTGEARRVDVGVGPGSFLVKGVF